MSNYLLQRVEIVDVVADKQVLDCRIVADNIANHDMQLIERDIIKCVESGTESMCGKRMRVVRIDMRDVRIDIDTDVMEYKEAGRSLFAPGRTRTSINTRVTVVAANDELQQVGDIVVKILGEEELARALAGR